MDEQLNSTHGTILKELSDIKSSLAVNTTETANIKASITEIKMDVKEIRQETVSRREFTDLQKQVIALNGRMEKLNYWQGKVIGYSGAAAFAIELIFRWFSK